MLLRSLTMRRGLIAFGIVKAPERTDRFVAGRPWLFGDLCPNHSSLCEKQREQRRRRALGSAAFPHKRLTVVSTDYLGHADLICF